MKKIICRYSEDQIHFGMSNGDEMSLALNDLKEVALHSISNTIPEHAQMERNN